MGSSMANESHELSLGEKALSIPISLVVIVLGIIELFNAGIAIQSVFPLFIGTENLIFIIHRRFPNYRTLALRLGVFLFAAMFFIILAI